MAMAADVPNLGTAERLAGTCYAVQDNTACMTATYLLHYVILHCTMHPAAAPCTVVRTLCICTQPRQNCAAFVGARKLPPSFDSTAGTTGNWTAKHLPCGTSPGTAGQQPLCV
jgi:hypothetical protein